MREETQAPCPSHSSDSAFFPCQQYPHHQSAGYREAKAALITLSGEVVPFCKSKFEIHIPGRGCDSVVYQWRPFAKRKETGVHSLLRGLFRCLKQLSNHRSQSRPFSSQERAMTTRPEKYSLSSSFANQHRCRWRIRSPCFFITHQTQHSPEAGMSEPPGWRRLSGSCPHFSNH